MTLSLHTIKPAPGSKRKKIIVGRGGKRGTYSGRGSKGQRARSGGRKNLKRMGLRKLMEQTPKLRGFKSRRPRPIILNIGDLNKNFKDGDVINPRILMEKKLIDGSINGVKILGDGELAVKVNVTGCTFSLSAKEKIEKVGGSIK